MASRQGVDWTRARLRQTPQPAHAIEGVDGWLFLGGDRNRVLDQHLGNVTLGRRAEWRWRRLLAARARRVRARGLELVAMIAPDKEAVYEDRLPPGLTPARERPVHKVIAAGRSAGLEILYPVAELVRARSTRETYFTSDSHWNSWGAFVAYRELCREIASRGIEIGVLGAEDVDWIEHEVQGDLGRKLDPPVRGLTVTGRLRRHRSRLAYDNRIANHGRLIRFETREPRGASCLLIGESYANHMLRFLKESFRVLVLAHSSRFDYGLIDAMVPDVIVWNPTERFLLEVPSDRRAGPAWRLCGGRSG